MIPIPGSFTVANIAARILDRLGAEHTIRKLRVMSHGTFGTAMIGQHINDANVGQLSPLRGRFSSESEGAFFHGCRIASDRSPTFGELHTLSCSEIDALRTSGDASSSFEDHMRGTWTPPPAAGSTLPTSSTGLNLPVGYRFMWMAAIAMNVQVTAPVDRQFAHVDAHGFDDSGWEGHYITVQPDGTNSGTQRGTPFHRIYSTYCEE